LEKRQKQEIIWIIDEIHEPDGGVPARMAPWFYFMILITHLFGGVAV
jgi:hypothetical protein